MYIPQALHVFPNLTALSVPRAVMALVMDIVMFKMTFDVSLASIKTVLVDVTILGAELVESVEIEIAVVDSVD